MKDLKFNEMNEISGGGFSYDMGCVWRYIAGYAVGNVSNGGPFSLIGHASGVIVAESVKCK